MGAVEVEVEVEVCGGDGDGCTVGLEGDTTLPGYSLQCLPIWAGLGA